MEDFEIDEPDVQTVIHRATEVWKPDSLEKLNQATRQFQQVRFNAYSIAKIYYSKLNFLLTNNMTPQHILVPDLKLFKYIARRSTNMQTTRVDQYVQIEEVINTMNIEGALEIVEIEDGKFNAFDVYLGFLAKKMFSEYINMVEANLEKHLREVSAKITAVGENTEANFQLLSNYLSADPILQDSYNLADPSIRNFVNDENHFNILGHMRKESGEKHWLYFSKLSAFDKRFFDGGFSTAPVAISFTSAHIFYDTTMFTRYMDDANKVNLHQDDLEMMVSIKEAIYKKHMQPKAFKNIFRRGKIRKNFTFNGTFTHNLHYTHLKRAVPKQTTYNRRRRYKNTLYDKMYLVPKLEEVGVNFKGRKIVGIDPGITRPITAVSEHSTPANSDVLFFKRKKWFKAPPKPDRIDHIEWEFNKTSPSDSLEIFGLIEYYMLRLKFKSELDSYYHSFEYCKHQFLAHKDKLAFFEELCSKLKQRYGQNAVYYVGDWSQHSKGGSGYATVSLRLYMMYHGLDVVSVDESYTSRTCVNCLSPCIESTSARVTNESGAKETKAIWSIKTCTNPQCMGDSHRTRKHQRDFQGAWNIVQIVKFYLDHCEDTFNYRKNGYRQTAFTSQASNYLNT